MKRSHKRYRHVHHTAWSPYEIRFMEHNAEHGAAFISRRLKRSLGAVYQKASNMGLKLGVDKQE